MEYNKEKYKKEGETRMKKTVITVLVVVVIAVAGFGGWYFLIKKSPEGGNCTNTARCVQGLNCYNKICSSGKLGSACVAKTDCAGGYCANSKCTDGQKGSSCATYKDCASGLLCQKSACATAPDYSKYFTKVNISKMKPGSPPGPDNPLVATTEFRSGDGITIDFIGVKSTTVGTFKYEVVNSTTGEIAVSSQDRGEVPNFSGRDFGTGTDLSAPTGTYDLNLYLNDTLIYTTPITVS